jgi:hypothetical protein
MTRRSASSFLFFFSKTFSNLCFDSTTLCIELHVVKLSKDLPVI